MDNTGQGSASFGGYKFRVLVQPDGTWELQVSEGGTYGDGAEAWKRVPFVKAADAKPWRDG